MMCEECGCALVLVYANGMRIAALAHRHDGGEAYMGPLLRRGVAYAKTHYDSGNIVDILLSETEMEKVGCGASDFARDSNVRHVYYVSYRWDAGYAKKVYAVSALHLKEERAEDCVPELLVDVPKSAKSVL